MPSPDVADIIERAIRERRVLRVTYRAENGTVGDHTIEPLAIRFNTAAHRVLWCWSRDVGHLEELLWEGIEAATETGDTFAPRPWGAGGEQPTAEQRSQPGLARRRVARRPLGVGSTSSANSPVGGS